MVTRFSTFYSTIVALVTFVAGVIVAPGSAHGIGSGVETKTSVWFAPPTQIIDGARLIDSGRVQEGMALTRKAFQGNLDPYILAMAYTNLCAGNLHLKLYKEAVNTCDRALAMRPSQWQALNNRGGARYGMGDFDAAIADYVAAMDYQPSNADIALNLDMAQRSKRAALPIDGPQR